MIINSKIINKLINLLVFNSNNKIKNKKYKSNIFIGF